MFLSSLHCTDEDHSLLDDCAHSQLGLAVCDEDSGVAGAKCLGRDGKCFEQHLVYYYAVIVFTSTYLALHTYETQPVRGIWGHYPRDREGEGEGEGEGERETIFKLYC